MALIPCPECQKEISDKAEFCVHCGYPMPEVRFIFTNKDNMTCPYCGSRRIFIGYRGAKISAGLPTEECKFYTCADCQRQFEK